MADDAPSPIAYDLLSPIPYSEAHPDALSVYCSDGRFTEAIEHLVHELGHPRLDTLTMPGGPALLDLTAASLGAVELVRGATSFLIRAHAIKRVVLVSHQGCGYYREKFRLDSKEFTERRQKTDLRAAARWIASNHAGVSVSGYHAHTVDHEIYFEAIETI